MRNSNENVIFDGTAAVNLYDKTAGHFDNRTPRIRTQREQNVIEALHIYPLQTGCAQSKFEQHARRILGDRSYEGLRGSETAFESVKSKVSVFAFFTTIFAFSTVLSALL